MRGSEHVQPLPAGHRLMLFFRELKLYMDLQERDSARLAQLHPLLEPHFEAIVDAFYEALWENPRTRAVFDGEAQVERLRVSLMGWLSELFLGPHDEAYVARRHRIGKRHVDVGLLPHFMFGAMNIVRVNIIQVIMEQEGVTTPEKITQVQAVEKALDLELTIMTQSYWDTLMQLKLQVPVALAMGLAHEIRNPLNAINLNVTLMERRLRALDADTQALEPMLEVMRSEIGRIRGLTSEIMDFAKPIPLSPRHVNAQAFLDELELVHGPTLAAAGLTWRAEVISGETIWCDADRMKQVMMNLVTNAVEASEPGDTLTCTVRCENKMVCITLLDEGAGMAPDMRHRIFDLFYTTKAGGTGIGLSIVRKIIDAHQGNLDVHSHPNRGTSFSLYLPQPH